MGRFPALASREPGALEYIAELGRFRIAASHNTAAIPSAEVAAEMRDRLFTLLRALVGAGPADVDVGCAEPAWGADLFLRVRARAETLSEGYPGIADRPGVQARVIEMHHAALLVKLLAGSTTSTPDILHTRLRDAVVAITIVMEAVFAEVDQDAPIPPSVAEQVSEDKSENASRLAGAASALGFELEPSGRLPKSLTHAKASRIRRAARGHGETLSAHVAAHVLAAHLQADHPLHPLRAVARLAPSLLLDVARLVDARGHGDDVTVTAAEVAELEAMVANDVRAVLEAID